MGIIVGRRAIHLLLALSVLHVAAERLKCKYEVMPVRDEFYVCFVINIETSSAGQLTIDGLSGVHATNKTDSDIEGVAFRQLPKLTSIPRGIERVVRSLKVLTIVNCSVSAVTQSDLKVFPDLITLSLHINFIQTLERDLFKFNPHLIYIALHDNPISHIDPLVFSDLNGLNYLILGSCLAGGNFGFATDAEAVKKIVKRIESGECSGAKGRGTEAAETLREDGQI